MVLLFALSTIQPSTASTGPAGYSGMTGETGPSIHEIRDMALNWDPKGNKIFVDQEEQSAQKAQGKSQDTTYTQTNNSGMGSTSPFDQQPLQCPGVESQNMNAQKGNNMPGCPPYVSGTGYALIQNPANPLEPIIVPLPPPPGAKPALIPPEVKNPTPDGQWSKGDADTMYQNRYPKALGIPSSRASRYVSRFMGAKDFAQRMGDPSNWAKPAQAMQQAQQHQASDAAASGAEQTMGVSIEVMRQSLINVANENAGAGGGNGSMPKKTLPQAIGMIQQMFKFCYIPMAILLLLPGAVATQAKGLVSYGVLCSGNDEDAVSPFAGIMRSMIAIFLIPATQVIVSWCTDVGNSMTYEVQQYIQPEEVLNWGKEQTFNSFLKNDANILNPASGGGGGAGGGGGGGMDVFGKDFNGSENQEDPLKQTPLARLLQLAFNAMNFAMSTGLAILLAFQTVMMSYLFLLGPIAAALYAWPSTTGFKKVFANWVDAVICLSLWRFWWCVIVLCMQTRIEWLGETGAYMVNTQWELAMYAAFMVMLTYLPFSPFNFAPGEMVDKILEKASQAQQQGGQQGGSAGQKGAGNGAGLGNQLASHGQSSPGAAANGGGGGGGGHTAVANNHSSESSQTSRLASVNVQTDSANNQSTHILPSMTQVAKNDVVQPEGINPPPVEGHQSRGMHTAAAPLMPPPPSERVA